MASDLQMNDKTLLELAAKAAGLYSETHETSVFGHFMGLNIREDDHPSGYCWNPLTDDGDALRLAVKLDMGIEVMKVLKEVRVGDGCGEIITERYSDDPYAATRRAIVRAAAEIGKAV